MDSLELEPQIKHSFKTSKYFTALSNERRIFATPWHWYVHGLGMGQETTGFDPEKATQLLEISLVLCQKTESTYHKFTHHLLKGIVATCEALSSGAGLAPQRVNEQFTKAIELLPDHNSWEYARACALLTEILVKLGQLESYRQKVHDHLTRALSIVAQLKPANQRLRYEQAQLLANLLLAAGQAEFTDLLTLRQNNAETYGDQALQVATTIADVFYLGRGSAIIFTILGIIGQGKTVYSGQHNHLQKLLDIFDSKINNLSPRDSDGVHQGIDYYLFPLSLILNAIAVLGCHDYLTYKRDWVAQAKSLFQVLAPASQASQITFLLSALDNLGVLNYHIPDITDCFYQCMTGYLNSTNGSQVDDYLRCTYLINLAYQLGISDTIHPRVWSILQDNVSRLLGSESYLESTYGSSYMVTAYAISAFDKVGKLDVLFGEKIGLPNAIRSFKDDPKVTAIHSPRTAFALIETGLKMRPLKSGDTLLLRNWKLANFPKLELR
ncbi:MAG: hypothetical protein WBM44_28735 [Waterburya sp.]